MSRNLKQEAKARYRALREEEEKEEEKGKEEEEEKKKKKKKKKNLHERVACVSGRMGA
jgi:hypothetical protein